jgi:hypothetical protein
MLRSDPSSWAVTPTRSAPTRPTASFSSPRSAESVVGTSRSNARADLMSASEKGPTSPERLGWAAERNLPAAKLLHPLPILPTCSSAWLARTTLVMFVHWPTATCRLPGQGGGAITSAAALHSTADGGRAVLVQQLGATSQHRPVYSITWSAMAMSDAGISRPSSFAVFALMINSNLIGA